MRELSFCFGSSRKAAVWRPAKMSVDELMDRLSTPMRTSETASQYHGMTKDEKEVVKDKGGFLAGTLKGARRKKTDVVSRSMVTLDCDKLTAGFFDAYKAEYYSILYTTHSHTPESPRARVLMPLTRDVTPEEYNAISRYLAEELGMAMIDPCSFKINQLMYWPTCPSDGEYICRAYEGGWLDPDVYLAAHPNWKDCAALPTAPAERETLERQRKKQEDPLSKTDIVGTFCRAYTIPEVVERYLSDVYAPTDKEDRYDYIPGEGSSGVVVYEDRFVYSHHATDPAGGKLLNAFDLVRAHLFDDEDPKKSFSDMAEFAAGDERVQALGLEERMARAGDDFAEPAEDDDWKAKLVRQKKSTQLENSLFNIKLIMQNDPFLKHIVFNQLADGMEISGEVPWKHPATFWRDADDAQLMPQSAQRRSRTPPLPPRRSAKARYRPHTSKMQRSLTPRSEKRRSGLPISRMPLSEPQRSRMLPSPTRRSAARQSGQRTYRTPRSAPPRSSTAPLPARRSRNWLSGLPRLTTLP